MEPEPAKVFDDYNTFLREFQRLEGSTFSTNPEAYREQI